MTDEINKLKKAFELESEIKSSERAKKLAMSSAMQAFEKQHETNSVNIGATEETKKSENNLQGNLSEDRQKDNANIYNEKSVGDVNLSYWRKLMKLSYLFPVAAAGTLAVSVLVLNPNILSSKSTLEGVLQEEPLNEVAIGANVAGREDDVTLSIPKPELKSESKKIANAPKIARKEKSSGGRFVSDKLAKRAAITQDESGQGIELQSTADTSNIVKNDKAVAGNVTVDSVAVESVGVDSVGVDSVAVKSIVANTVASPAPIAASPERKKRAFNKKTVVSKPLSRPILEQEASMLTAQIEEGRDKFESIKTNPLKLTKEEPVSTFSVDVDTASYSFMRAAINRNSLPQKDAIRVEELINYFPYDYPQPSDSEIPFQVNTTVMPTPWNEKTKLLHIGIKGYTLPKQETPKSNLVFLLDTSGSMSQPNKLPLLINSFKLLLSTLHADDTVSIVAYAGSAGTVLEPTKVKERAKITQALERLRAGGSTAGGQGIRLAYQLAEANFDEKGVNRVILATDGDFNVGIRSQDELKSFIERKRESGVFLSVLGFGMGNYNDALMQTLAQNGNGNAAYIDSLSEARKVLVEEASSTLFTIAKDVKVQMEFNPKVVSEYRLIGYETRALKREDFNNDKVDAGDIGAGHTVTAIYEITPVGAENTSVDPLRYAEKRTNSENKKIAETKPTEYGFLKLRYKLPKEDKSRLIQTPILIADTLESIDKASTETRFATAVAAFGQLLRGGTYTKSFSYDDVIELAQKAKGEDLYGYRAEFISLVRLAKTGEALRLGN